ncbi:pentatricopeptide repeat-containing protein at1g71490 [Phtheirospermum japonicum]|uniref:Pentatricopeptide repeat-containing protein at1g71490 n=1 Tax=Phtheirospermum japonicum TaxID=374723 RepID=A0A830CNN4_9LAMI|nr:pentatricopeptide repeat-containing protein at1g71490 [Phtheirospermum japonicum]
MVDCLITTLKDSANRGHLSKAFKTFSHIQEHALPSASSDLIIDSLSSLLLSCTKLKLLREGQQLHAQVITHGLHKNHSLVPKLVSYYVSLDFLDVARSITADSNTSNPFPWNKLISSYVNKACFDEAISAYKQMVLNGARPDYYTYPSVLKACAEQSDLVFGIEVHNSVKSSCLTHDLFGMWDRAFELFESMRAARVEISIITWNTVSGGYLRTGNFKRALELTRQIRENGDCLDPVAVIIGLNACSHISASRLGKEIHGSAIRNSSVEYENVKNALITFYSRCGDVARAYIVFRSVENKKIITWNSIISGFAQHGKEFHCYIARREEFKGYLLLWNALIDMYARSGKVSIARRLFDSMENRDTVTYTSIISGYGVQGDGKVAVELFEEMIRFGIKPDRVAMVAILSACSHSGLVGLGRLYFEKMMGDYGVKPNLEHFACMADLYGRAGLVNEPTCEMWATLIGACRIHGDMDIGEWAAEKLLEMKPRNSGYYVLIANMYGAAGCWEKLAKVRTFMRDLGVRKNPGCALVDVGDGFLPFLVEDSSNGQADEIYLLLGGLTKLMKDVDCVEYGEEEETLNCN